MSTTKINGWNVLVCVGTDLTAVATTAPGGQQNATCSISNETIEIASSSQSSAREYITGLYDWSLEVTGLYVSGDSKTLASYLIAGTKLSVAFKVGTEVWSGLAYVSSFKADGQVKNKATYSATLRGTGAITIS